MLVTWGRSYPHFFLLDMLYLWYQVNTDLLIGAVYHYLTQLGDIVVCGSNIPPSPTKQAGLELIRGCTRQHETRIRMIDSRNIASCCKKNQQTTTETRMDSGTALLAWEEMPIQWWQLAKILVSMFGNVILKPAATNITAWTRGTSEFPSSCKSLKLTPCLRCCRFGRCREVKRLSLPSTQDYR